MFTNIKMNKKQKKKLRKDTLQLLETQKSKLNNLTYLSLKNKIEDKRIDAVKRINERLRDIRTTTKTGIVQKDIKKIGEEIKSKRAKQLQGLARNLNLRYVKRQSEYVGQGTTTIWNRLKTMNGEVRVSIVDDGNVIRSFTIDLDRKSGDAYFGLYYDTEYNNLFEEYPDADVIITKDANIRPQRIAQAFKQGITNCLFKPIIDYFQMKEETAQTEGTRLKYKSKVSVSKKLEAEYHDSGVPEKDLQAIADKLQVGLKIHLPFNINLVEVKPNKKALTNFEYINTKLNHIDGFNHNEIVNKKTEQITHKAMTDMYNKLVNDGDYFIFKKNHTGVCKISTINKTYTISQDFSEFIDEFLVSSNLINCRICDIQDYNLSQYVRAGNHSNQCIDFKPIHIVDDPENHINTDGLEMESGRYCVPYTGYKHIDQAKAYKNVNKCKYYEGYVGKICDFRPTDKIVDIGMYTITNLKLSPVLEKLNNKMLIFGDGMVFPSPVLKFLKDKGCEFDITEGCWGINIDFNFDDPRWLNKSDDGRKKKTSWYSKFVGVMEMEVLTDNFYMNADKDYISNLTSYLQEGTYKTWEDEVKFMMNKDSNKHLSHITAFIKSYCLINTLEQLMSMNYDDIIRVVCDGIYHFGDYELLNNFREEEKTICYKQFCGGTFISNRWVEKTWKLDCGYRPHHKREFHKGAGGTGKTTKVVVDSGFQKICYFAPSWKLARQKQKEHNIKCNVFYNLISKDPACWRPIIKNYNVLVIDEVSMLNNKFKELFFERFKECKIIMCGDVGHQLDGIDDPNYKVPYVNFNEEGFDYIEEHTTNYRVKCDKLLTKLNYIRKLQGEERRKFVKQYVLNNFQKIDEIKDYKVEDMILARTHKTKDTFTEKFKHLEKYYITENTQNYCNGEISYTKPVNTRCELRHAFTTHSIQGETAEHNLYICINDMYDDKMIYTALSRARRWEQIYLLTSTNGTTTTF
jgi:hypothetical protein